MVSSCESPTEGISKFVHYHLNLLVRKKPSHIRDIINFLIKLQNLKDLSTDVLLVTLYVTWLSTNILHNKGIETCRAALKSRYILEPPTEDVNQLIRLVIERNNFTFKDDHYMYLQIDGMATSTRVALSYSNIFTSRVQNKILEMVDKDF